MSSALWRKAEDAAASAHLLFKAEMWDAACNRAYYAAFNAARACLVTLGYPPDRTKTHSAVLTHFALEFVKSGIIDIETGRALRILEKVRMEADYSESNVDANDTEQAMNDMDAFLDAVRQYLIRVSQLDESNAP